MEGTLQKIVAGQKVTHKQLEKQENTLQQILGVNSNLLDVEKQRLAQEKRDAQEAKRKKADERRSNAIKGKEFKKSEGILSKLGNLFGNLFGNGGLMRAILAGLGLGAGGGLMSMIMQRLFPRQRQGQGLMSRIMERLFGRGKTGGEKGIFTKMLESIRNGITGMFQGKGVFGPQGFLSKLGTKAMVKGGGIIAALTAGITEYFASGSFADALFAGGGAGVGAVGGGLLGSLLGPLGTIVGAALGGFIGDQLGKILKDQLDKNEFLKGIFEYVDAEFERMLESFRNLFEAYGEYFNELKETFRLLGVIIGNVANSVGDFLKGTWEKFTGAVTTVGNFLSDTFGPILETIGGYLEGTFEPLIISISDFLKPIIDPLKELVNTIIPPLMEGFKGLGEFLKPFLNPAAAIADGATAFTQGATGLLGNFNNFLRGIAGEEKKQRGGFVGTVPNQGGNGDRFHTMVQPGSVVMNQVAAGMFQSGGLVPVALEQREIVVPPGPNAGAALMMNSMFPRFQTGGVVETDGVPDTGPGYQPGNQKDYYGRPVVFSKAGAEAWAGYGSNVRGQDVNSSKRSPAKNRAVGGVSNSNHLYGTGVDVQTGSPSWHFLKKNAGAGGWMFNNYLGPQGWHWDFKGSGMAITPKEGDEDGIAKGIIKMPNALADFMSTGTPQGEGAKELEAGFKGLGGAMKIFGAAGGGMGEQFAALVSGLKEELGGLGDILFGGIGGSKKESFIGPQPGSAQNAGAAGGGEGNSGGQASGAQSANEMYKRMGFTSAQWDLYRNTVAQIESGGKYNIAGGSGGHYDGRYQLGAAAKTDGARYAGISDPGHGAGARAAFRKDPKLQEQLFTGFTMANYKYLMGNTQFANASKERQLQILGYAHNQGMGGAEKWMTTGVVGRDGFGTKGTKYTDSIAAEFKKAKGLQTGGVAQVRGAGSANTANMVTKTQENFAEMIADKVTPMVIPMPVGGGGGTQVIPQSSNSTPFPDLPAEDNSIVSMEYKYRITMGASV